MFSVIYVWKSKWRYVRHRIYSWLMGSLSLSVVEKWNQRRPLVTFHRSQMRQEPLYGSIPVAITATANKSFRCFFFKLIYTWFHLQSKHKSKSHRPTMLRNMCHAVSTQLAGLLVNAHRSRHSVSNKKIRIQSQNWAQDLWASSIICSNKSSTYFIANLLFKPREFFCFCC